MPGKGNILVVEDEPVNATYIAHQLTKLGYSILAAVGSGREAVQISQEKRPDLVLMDVGLEGEMDGVEAATLIHEKTGIPVVFLTGSSDESTIDRARSTEAFGYLYKPLQEREARSTLELALYKAEMQARLDEERKWLATTLRCINDAVIATDATGAVKLINPAAERLTGWKQQEALGRDLSEIFKVFDESGREPAECAVTELLTEGGQGGFVSTKCLVSRDGHETIIQESASPITNESGVTCGIVLVFRPSESDRSIGLTR